MTYQAALHDSTNIRRNCRPVVEQTPTQEGLLGTICFPFQRGDYTHPANDHRYQCPPRCPGILYSAPQNADKKASGTSDKHRPPNPINSQELLLERCSFCLQAHNERDHDEADSTRREHGSAHNPFYVFSLRNRRPVGKHTGAHGTGLTKTVD